jgi:RNA polymerase sigma factor (sigma-70 family)
MNTPKAVVYIVEDDASFRKSMERLIRPSGYDVVAFESANSFLAQESIRHPGCLLLDVRLPDIDGLRLQQKIIERGINLPIIFMTGHGTIPMSVQAMKNGAIDFLPKPFQTEDLLNAVVKALERDTYNVQEEVQRSKINSLINSLTPREKEIMRWIITGKLNKQIAYDLGITEKTVKVHRSRVMQKLKVSSVAELVRLTEKVNISPADSSSL